MNPLKRLSWGGVDQSTGVGIGEVPGDGDGEVSERRVTGNTARTLVYVVERPVYAETWQSVKYLHSRKTSLSLRKFALARVHTSNIRAWMSFEASYCP